MRVRKKYEEFGTLEDRTKYPVLGLEDGLQERGQILRDS